MKTPCWNRLLPLFAVLIAAAPPINAQSKMFKCTIDGRTVYQQTACPVTQQANDAKPAAEAAFAPASSASRAAARAREPRALPRASPAARRCRPSRPVRAPRHSTDPDPSKCSRSAHPAGRRTACEHCSDDRWHPGAQCVAPLSRGRNAAIKRNADRVHDALGSLVWAGEAQLMAVRIADMEIPLAPRGVGGRGGRCQPLLYGAAMECVDVRHVKDHPPPP
jgi:hypothetical protein